MATWMVHLRIADRLMSLFGGKVPDETAFVMGSIAPDSGVTDGHGGYTPGKEISHFRTVDADGGIVIGWRPFAEAYLPAQKRKRYDPAHLSFYLGYLTHLMADDVWFREVYRPLESEDAESFRADKGAALTKWKRDWYDLDRRFLRDHPDFRAYRLFCEAEGFRNCYLDFFSETALGVRQRDICAFYARRPDDLDRTYLYLTEAQVREYLDHAIAFIQDRLAALDLADPAVFDFTDRTAPGSAEHTAAAL